MPNVDPITYCSSELCAILLRSCEHLFAAFLTIRKLLATEP